MAENKRVGLFFLTIMVVIAGFIAWLMLFQPEPTVVEVIKEVPNDRIFGE